MRTQPFMVLAGAIILGGWLNPAFSQHYPPSPNRPEPGQQTIEEQDEIFRQVYMTDEEEVEFNDQLSKTKYAWERDLVRRQQNQLMRQRAAQQGLTSHEEYLPGFPATPVMKPGSVWWCFYHDCYKREPLFPIIYYPDYTEDPPPALRPPIPIDERSIVHRPRR